MAEVVRKKLSRRFDEPVIQDAGTRSNGIDTVTCFAIPGSYLPARHCDVNLTVTLLQFADMSIYISLNNQPPQSNSESEESEPASTSTTAQCPLGSIKQFVKGRKYNCKLFMCPYQFKMTIPTGPSDWSRVRFTDMSDNPINLNTGQDTKQSGNESYTVYLLSEGRVEKTYENTFPFEWVFGPCEIPDDPERHYEVGGSYKEESIIASMPTNRPDTDNPGPHHGGLSKSDSRFKLCGNLGDWGWSKGLNGESTDGKIWLCGGILYDSATITSQITAVAVDVTIPGLNLGTYYYPGDIRKFERMSLNRPEGYLKICSKGRKNLPSSEPNEQDELPTDRLPDYILDDSLGESEEESEESPESTSAEWRPVKNTENDFLTDDPESGYENWGFRLQNDKWKRLILTGKVTENDENELDDSDGIGSDSPGSTGGSQNGICPCCQMR